MHGAYRLAESQRTHALLRQNQVVVVAVGVGEHDFGGAVADDDVLVTSIDDDEPQLRVAHRP
jgi:hypothetical protein